MKKPGDYIIQHNVTGLRYIGSSKNPLNRVHGHIWHLRRNTHVNYLFQEAWNASTDFYLVVHETKDLQTARNLERAFLKEPTLKDKLLNITSVHDKPKGKQSPEHLAKRLPLLLERIKKQRRKIMIDDKVYESIRYCERKRGISQRTIVRRIESNKPEYAGWKYV